MASGGVGKGKDRDLQVAALPLRVGPAGGLEVLLVTSRETQRWVLPKGNPVKGMSLAQSAAIEAEEEAGIFGRIVPKPYRRFDYWKRRSDGFRLFSVDVFLLVVTRQDAVWKEAGERRRTWVSPGRAREMVDEPGLQTILRALESDETVPDLVRPKEERAGQRRWAELVLAISAA